jgi:hypothetical protein
MKKFLVNILAIWDGRCDFFGSLSVVGRKKGGVKKKSSKNSRFLCSQLLKSYKKIYISISIVSSTGLINIKINDKLFLITRASIVLFFKI